MRNLKICIQCEWFHWQELHNRRGKIVRRLYSCQQDTDITKDMEKLKAFEKRELFEDCPYILEQIINVP